MVVIKPLIVLLTTVVFSFTNKIDSYQMPSKRAFDPDPNCWKLSTIFPTIKWNRAGLGMKRTLNFEQTTIFVFSNWVQKRQRQFSTRCCARALCSVYSMTGHYVSADSSLF